MTNKEKCQGKNGEGPFAVGIQADGEICNFPGQKVRLEFIYSLCNLLSDILVILLSLYLHLYIPLSTKQYWRP